MCQHGYIWGSCPTCNGIYQQNAIYPNKIEWNKPGPLVVPLSEKDKMELISFLGEMHNKKALRDKIQKVIEETIESREVTLTGETLLLMLYALIFTLKYAEDKA